MKSNKEMLEEAKRIYADKSKSFEEKQAAIDKLTEGATNAEKAFLSIMCLSEDETQQFIDHFRNNEQIAAIGRAAMDYKKGAAQ